MTFSLAPVVGGLSDAWAELRTHKLRVMLSLIGITVSVAALTATAAIGAYVDQYNTEQSDRFGGRVATMQFNASSETGSIDETMIDAQFDRVAQRYEFAGSTVFGQGLTVDFPVAGGFKPAQLELVGADYSAVFREDLIAGRGLREGDEQLMAPPIVVTEFLWGQLGYPTMDTHPLIELGGDLAGTYQIVGVLAPRWGGGIDPMVRMLWESYRDRAELPEGAALSRYVWVNADTVNEIGPMLTADLRQGLAEGVTISGSRTDWMAYGPNPGALVAQLVVGGVAGMVLLLAALGLVNVQLVAMRQRVREIGVRRAFGASQARLFTTVPLESVVATTVAGVVGVAIVVAALRAGVVELMMPGVQDVPPVPYVAAFIGLGASVLIGALAGLVPATVAIRVKVIDAIRF